MKAPDDHRSADADREAEAMAWLAERDEGFSPERAAAFEAWQRRDPRHRAAVAELEQVLADLDRLADRRDEVNLHFSRETPPRPAVSSRPVPPMASVRWWRPVAWGAVAAVLATAAFLGFQAGLPTVDPGIRYATDNGGYRRARLDDGSTLELNAASIARVHFTPGERRVELEAGEAHFEVAHDTARPFVVRVHGVAVRAVGTAFNVRLAADAVEVTVTEGKVSIGPGVGPRRDAGTENGPALLGALERLAIPFAAGPAVRAGAVERLAPAEVRAALAWQRRITDFSDTPLAEVAARFNRHHALRLVIADPALGARRIGGLFALDDVEAFVRLLEHDGIVRAVRTGDTVRLEAP